MQNWTLAQCNHSVSSPEHTTNCPPTHTHCTFTWKMSTLKLFLLIRVAWLASNFFTWTACLSILSLTSFMWTLTLRLFSRSLLTVFEVEVWLLESLVISFWISLTAPSISTCLISILCWFSCTVSSMFTSLSRSVRTVMAFTWPVGEAPSLGRMPVVPPARAPGLLGSPVPSWERLWVGEDWVGLGLGTTSSWFSCVLIMLLRSACTASSPILRLFLVSTDNFTQENCLVFYLEFLPGSPVDFSATTFLKLKFRFTRIGNNFSVSRFSVPTPFWR